MTDRIFRPLNTSVIAFIALVCLAISFQAKVYGQSQTRLVRPQPSVSYPGARSNLTVSLSSSPSSQAVALPGRILSNKAFSGLSFLNPNSNPNTFYSGKIKSISSLSGVTAVTSMFPNKRLVKLNNHDVVVLMDKSSSMRTIDAPGGLSRWDWTKNQLMDLSGQLGRLPQSNLDLVLFDNDAFRYPSVKITSLPPIFNQNTPSGGTNVSRAMKSEIDSFLERQKSTGYSSRPLVMAVITDGAPGSARALKDLIINTTHRLNNRGQLKITFLQVGSESQGNRLIPELDNELVRDGALFDIVETRSFGELVRTGLVNALIDAVS